MTTPVQHCLITGAYLPIIKRRVNLCSTYIQFQDNYPSEYKRFGVSRDEMMILMPQVMSVDVLSGIDKLKYVGEDECSKDTQIEITEMKMGSKILADMGENDARERHEEDDAREMHELDDAKVRHESNTISSLQSMSEERPQSQSTNSSKESSRFNKRDDSDDYYDYDVAIDEDYDDDEEFTDDYDD